LTTDHPPTKKPTWAYGPETRSQRAGQAMKSGPTVSSARRGSPFRREHIGVVLQLVLEAAQHRRGRDAEDQAQASQGLERDGTPSLDLLVVPRGKAEANHVLLCEATTLTCTANATAELTEETLEVDVVDGSQ
jgi:hypothetical protein